MPPTLREIEFELSQGRPRNPVLQAFWDRPGLEAVTSAVYAGGDSMWLIFAVTGPGPELEAARVALRGPLGAPIEAIDASEDGHGGLVVAVRWGRPDTAGGPGIEHLLAEMAASGTMMRIRVHQQRIEIRALSHDGEALLRFYQAMRSMLAARYQIRLLRMGESRASREAQRDLLRRDEVELLELALARGYYDDPKRCGVRELGDALGFSKSVVARKLRTLERRALEQMKTPLAAPE